LATLTGVEQWIAVARRASSSYLVDASLLAGDLSLLAPLQGDMIAAPEEAYRTGVVFIHLSLFDKGRGA